MRALFLLVSAIVCTLLVASTPLGLSHGQAKPQQVVSFKESVLPLLRRSCLPCHAEGSSNPSELALDSRELLLKGGKSGAPIVPGKADSSMLILKLGPNPPFGDRMPLHRKRDTRVTTLSDEEVTLIATWINQGSKDN